MLRPPTRVTPLLLPKDFGTALKEAGIDGCPDVEALFRAALSAFLPAQRVVSAQHSPGIGEIRHVGMVLGEIEQACLAALKPIVAQMAVLIPEEDAPGTLACMLLRSRDPVVIALLSAVGAPEDGNLDGQVATLARVLLATDQLRDWAGAARKQYEAGVASQKQSRASPAARSPARELGLVLIQSYVQLTGRQPAFSRKPPNAEGAGEPTGPLIRYLQHLFGCARRALAADPEQARLVQKRAWNPSAETLGSWVTRAQKEVKTPP